jgi:hypothetical protein
LSQRLAEAGKQAMDAPATLESRARVIGTGQSIKNDPNDMLSVAIVTLRTQCEVCPRLECRLKGRYLW